MLSTMRQSWLLCTLCALMALSSALNIEEALHIDGIEAYLHHGYQRRQAGGTGSSASAPETSAPASSAEPSSETPASTPASTPTPTPTPTPSASSADDQPSSTPAPSTPQSSAGPSSTPEASSTPPPSKTSKTPVVSTSFQVATSLEPFTSTVVLTLSNGQVSSSLSTGSRTNLITTGQVQVTDPASLSNGGSNGDGGGGLSESNKKIIGGVVGGVGGAILLGGIAIVCWRIWGRKKHVRDDDADLMAGTGSALGDKPPSSANSPFQANLEQYHNPGGRPNAAANF